MTRKANLLDLIRTPNLAFKSVNVFFNWFVNSLVYYGLSLNVGNLSVNIYLAHVISGAVEIPAYIMCQIILPSPLGRRVSLCGTMLLGGLALLLTSAFPRIFKKILKHFSYYNLSYFFQTTQQCCWFCQMSANS